MPEMNVALAEIHMIEMPLKFRFETSFGVQTSKLVPILVLHDSDGTVGLAEGVMDPDWPLYREETVDGTMPLIHLMLNHYVVGHPLNSPAAFNKSVAHLKGNRMAKAMIEMAIWDLFARKLGLPLRDVIGGTGDSVMTGVSLGIQATIDDTIAIVGRHVDLGYRRIKLKIKPGWDLEVLRAVRAEFPRLTMTADANSAYTLADRAHLRKIDEVGLDYIEQPLAWDDLVDHATLAKSMDTLICLDESIVDATSARQAIQLGSAQVVNLKLGRVGGHSEAIRIDAVARASGVPLWCGGMLETGVGRAHNIHIATLPSFTKPGDISSASRYWERDITVERLETVDGIMALPDGPGIGVTLDMDAVEGYRINHTTISADS
jgi:o-succinylbenzoate synthase